MRSTSFIIIFAILVIGIVFGIGYLSIFYKKTVGVASENANREVFEATRSYNQAKIQELAKYKAEWDSADIEDRSGIESIIKHRFADMDATKIPVGLSSFLRLIRGY